jgi:hypothetical protein
MYCTSQQWWCHERHESYCNLKSRGIELYFHELSFRSFARVYLQYINSKTLSYVYLFIHLFIYLKYLNTLAFQLKNGLKISADFQRAVYLRLFTNLYVWIALYNKKLIKLIYYLTTVSNATDYLNSFSFTLRIVFGFDSPSTKSLLRSLYLSLTLTWNISKNLKRPLTKYSVLIYLWAFGYQSVTVIYPLKVTDW